MKDGGPEQKELRALLGDPQKFAACHERVTLNHCPPLKPTFDFSNASSFHFQKRTVVKVDYVPAVEDGVWVWVRVPGTLRID
jgi:hypothetical protein